MSATTSYSTPPASACSPSLWGNIESDSFEYESDSGSIVGNTHFQPAFTCPESTWEDLQNDSFEYKLDSDAIPLLPTSTIFSYNSQPSAWDELLEDESFECMSDSHSIVGNPTSQWDEIQDDASFGCMSDSGSKSIYDPWLQIHNDSFQYSSASTSPTCSNLTMSPNKNTYEWNKDYKPPATQLHRSSNSPFMDSNSDIEEANYINSPIGIPDISSIECQWI